MIAFSLRTTFTAAAISAVMLAGAAPVVADDNSEGNDRDARLVIYFTRHAEKQTVTMATDIVPPGYTSTVDADPFFSIDESRVSVGKSRNDVCGEEKCAEELSTLGEKRAMLLADWFANREITGELDAVFATHKTRTQQTVMPTATVAGMGVTVLNPEMSELADESTSASQCSTLRAIKKAKADGMDTILIAGHSGTLYKIMGSGVTGCTDHETKQPLTGLGLETVVEGEALPTVGYTARFPKDAKGKVRDYGDIWKVVITRNGEVRFRYRANLQPARLKVDNIAQ